MIPDACTLPTADRPFRLAEFADVFAHATGTAERLARTRLRLVLEPSPRVAARVAELGTAETGCCSFFTFTLRIASGSLTLDVTVPDAYASALDAIAATATSTASATASG